MFITSNEQQHGDLGEVEKYHRGAALEVAFVCQLCELATPRAEAIKGPWEASVEQIPGPK